MQPVLPVHVVARLLLILLLAAGVYFFSGFVVPVLAALIIGFASWPLYSKWVQVCGGRTTLAASVALLFIMLVLVAPLSIALSYSVQEASHILAELLTANRVGVQAPAWIVALPYVGERLGSYWAEFLAQPHALGGLVELPFLPTFFGLVGGVKTMGIVGLFIGPVLMALMVALWREWVLDVKVAQTERSSPSDG